MLLIVLFQYSHATKQQPVWRDDPNKPNLNHAQTNLGTNGPPERNPIGTDTIFGLTG